MKLTLPRPGDTWIEQGFKYSVKNITEKRILWGYSCWTDPLDSIFSYRLLKWGSRRVK